MRYFFFAFVVVIVAVVAVAGFRGEKTPNRPFEIFPDMDHQPKFKAQAGSDYFADGRSDRGTIPGTIPTSVPVEDPYKVTGMIEGNWGDGIPFEVTDEFLARGQERFNINCAVCHGATGSGNGITSQYGVPGAANYHTDRIIAMPDGEIYNTIVHGKGNMIGLPHLQIRDRWAIIAYIRALQISQTATINDVPQEAKDSLK